MTDKVEELYFVWVDEDGVRCGPRHQTLKAALNYTQNWGQGTRWITEDGESKLVPLHTGSYPSDKKPHELKVAELRYEPLSAETQAKVDQIKSLMGEGLI